MTATTSHIDVLICGQVFCDLVFSGVPELHHGGERFAHDFALSPGGAANRAVAAARLGASTMLVTELATDPLGNVVRAQLESEPNLTLVLADPSRCTRTPVTVALASETERSFITYRQTGWDAGWFTPDRNIAAAHINVMSPAPTWAAALRSAGTVLVAGVGWDATRRWSSTVIDRLADVDVFIPNEVEAKNYTGAASAREAAERLGEVVGLVVVTRGREGVVAFDRSSGSVVELPAPSVDAVDPTGAGDVFTAAFLSATAWQWPLVERLRLATLAAAASVRSLGGASGSPQPRDMLHLLDEGSPIGDWSFIRRWAESSATDVKKENRS